MDPGNGSRGVSGAGGGGGLGEGGAGGGGGSSQIAEYNTSLDNQSMEL